MSSMFPLCYMNTQKFGRTRKKTVETLACWLMFTQHCSFSPVSTYVSTVELNRNITHVFYFLNRNTCKSVVNLEICGKTSQNVSVSTAFLILQYNTIQIYCHLPMGAFQRQWKEKNIYICIINNKLTIKNYR